MSGKRGLLALLLAAGMVVGSGCTAVRNPATGETERTFMTPDEEVALGRESHPGVLQEFGGGYEDPALAAYVERIGGQLKSVSELPELDFTFTVLNDERVNAFALPGGYVYITRGLLALANDEAEVAGVLGHEIGHVTARHSAQRHTRSVTANLGAVGLSVLGAVLLGDAGAQLGQQIGSTGAQAWVAGYSRDQEFEADQLGVRYLARADYDPQGMASFLETLGRQSDLARSLAGRSAEGAQSTWFATHPRTPDRVVRAAAEAGSGGRIGRQAYLERIDGLLYGEDPSQGFVLDREFIHPDLRFRFRAPKGFQLINTPQAVLGGDQAGRRLRFDAARVARGKPLTQYVAGDWAQDLGAGGLDARPITVNGMEGTLAVTGGALKSGGEVEVRLAAVRAEGDRVYRFLFISPARAGDRFRRMLESFRRLSADQAAAYRPKRIRVVTVKSGERPEDFAGRMEFAPDERLAQFLVLNGLAADAKLAAGQRVKLVVEG